MFEKFSAVLHPLEDIVAGKDSKEKLTWTDIEMKPFKGSQGNLRKSETLIQPKREDQIQL